MTTDIEMLVHRHTQTVKECEAMLKHLEQIRVRLEQKQYSIARNGCIPEAEKIAYDEAGPRPPKGSSDSVKHEWSEHWNKVYAEAMDRLCQEALL